jgi:hypothetical protein
MFLSTAQVIGMTEASLRDFLSLAIKELYYLDYKVALSGKTEKEEKREFLKDVSAFANAAGGDMIIGVLQPKDGLSVNDQLVGIENGDEVAGSLERLAAASLDPRVSGLLVVPVDLTTGRSCIVVHVPPSMSRPHMVSQDGHRSFYIRHTESSVPMSTHEIRESVLSAASAEAKARNFSRDRLDEVRRRFGTNHPVFFLQAIPLIAPATQWNVLAPEFHELVNGHDRNAKYSRFPLSLFDVRPTIDGLRGRDDKVAPSTEVEVHRSGYVSAIQCEREIDEFRNFKGFFVHRTYCNLFKAFTDILKQVWQITATDVPYLINCACLNAGGVRLVTEPLGSVSDAFEKEVLVWPEHPRATGEDPTPIADALCLEMFNAFGLRSIS